MSNEEYVIVTNDKANEIMGEYEAKGYKLTSYLVNKEYSHMYFEKSVDRQNAEDIMIMSTSNITDLKEKIMETFWQQGLMGVYNLGMSNMYEYLRGKE